MTRSVFDFSDQHKAINGELAAMRDWLMGGDSELCNPFEMDSPAFLGYQKEAGRLIATADHQQQLADAIGV